MRSSVLIPRCTQGHGQNTTVHLRFRNGVPTVLVGHADFARFAPTWMLAASCHSRKVSLQRRLQDFDRVLHDRGKKGTGPGRGTLKNGRQDAYCI